MRGIYLSAIGAAEVVNFWREAGHDRWFRADSDFDAIIGAHFGDIHQLASQGKLASWESTDTGSLALVILTDQVPRNIYRGSAHAFATGAMARSVACRAIAQAFDRAFKPAMRQFFYLPFSHDENAASQVRAVALYEELTAEGGDPEELRFARLHAALMERFGRFPHRNDVMGRVSTPEEANFLMEGGFRG